MAIKNLVFQGGGVKGIAYVGALQVLQARNLLRSVENVAGTSAGAITAALVAVGSTAEEMHAILGSTDFASFMDGRGKFIGGAVRLYEGYGIHKGEEFQQWCRQQISDITKRVTGTAMPDLTFSQLSALAAQQPEHFCNLYVVATNLNRQVPEVFSAQTYPDVPLWQAVRMSMSIPLFFEAFPFNGDLYVDGGVSWNYPIDLFDGLIRQPVIGKPPVSIDVGVCAETLGFSLGTPEQIQRLEKDGLPLPVSVSDLKTYTKALFNFMLGASNLLHLDPDSIQRTVFIDNANVSTTDFTLSDELKQKLVDNGVLATTAWFKNAEQKAAAAAQRAVAS
ncbi:patatin-like phospholipase family protein [Hyalangium minutum]|uniref:Lysophospholipase-like family protein n=1 Tax=Hyalangium minutum TaxID=394096 RepID=A0A085W6F3_9BACT|nr:patatin-like phospholipase family protein [Hyalangium minutum]KFE63266.1 lysophospholipase-like family protein [Hyalangium minutum]